jgi:hypothetical protein
VAAALFDLSPHIWLIPQSSPFFHLNILPPGN